jgi:hypothetical protein
MNEILVEIFRFLHFVGLAALLGGLLVQLRSEPRSVNAAMVYGAFTQLVTGIVLLLLTMADANHLKVTVKLVVLLVVVVIILVRRKKPLTATQFYLLLALTVVDLGLAVFW